MDSGWLRHAGYERRPRGDPVGRNGEDSLGSRERCRLVSPFLAPFVVFEGVVWRTVADEESWHGCGDGHRVVDSRLG